jgi:hypothetical protein
MAFGIKTVELFASYPYASKALDSRLGPTAQRMCILGTSSSPTHSEDTVGVDRDLVPLDKGLVLCVQ